MNTSDLTPPVNLEAEAAVIGSCLLDRDAIIPIAANLEADDFYDETNRRMYSCIRSLYERRVPADLITIGDELQRHGWYDECGGLPGISNYAKATPTSYHVEYYAQIVLDKSLGRAVIDAGRDIAAAGYEEEDRETLAARVENRMQRSLLRGATSKFVWSEQALDETMAMIGSGGARYTPTGIVSLDHSLVGGLYQDALYTLAARPGQGKTWLGCQIAYNVMRRGGLVLFYSYEMKRSELMGRILSIHTKLDNDRIRRPDSLSTDDLQRLSRAQETLKTSRLAIRDDFGLLLNGITSGAIGIQAEHGQVDLVIVDYLQLSTTGTKKKEPNRVEEVGEISRGLKVLAGTLGCPVLALSQMNRAVEGRTDSAPRLSDLRESGSIEQDSDGVLFLQKNPDADKLMNVIIAKQRSGPQDVTVKLWFNPATGRWADLDTHHSA